VTLIVKVQGPNFSVEVLCLGGGTSTRAHLEASPKDVLADLWWQVLAEVLQGLETFGKPLLDIFGGAANWLGAFIWKVAVARCHHVRLHWRNVVAGEAAGPGGVWLGHNLWNRNWETIIAFAIAFATQLCWWQVVTNLNRHSLRLN